MRVSRFLIYYDESFQLIVTGIIGQSMALVIQPVALDGKPERGPRK